MCNIWAITPMTRERCGPRQNIEIPAFQNEPLPEKPRILRMNLAKMANNIQGGQTFQITCLLVNMIACREIKIRGIHRVDHRLQLASEREWIRGVNYSAAPRIAAVLAGFGAPTLSRRSDSEMAPPSAMTTQPSQIRVTSGFQYMRMATPPSGSASPMAR